MSKIVELSLAKDRFGEYMIDFRVQKLWDAFGESVLVLVFTMLRSDCHSQTSFFFLICLKALTHIDPIPIAPDYKYVGMVTPQRFISQLLVGFTRLPPRPAVPPSRILTGCGVKNGPRHSVVIEVRNDRDQAVRIAAACGAQCGTAVRKAAWTWMGG